MVDSYLPVLVFLALGTIVGTAFATLNRVIGPRRPSPTKSDPYECGLPSDVRRGFRFGISFLYPVAVHLEAEGAFVLGEIAVFVTLLAVAFVYVWRRGALEWK
jgi:NADH-quinone oxidoreductase subunit A